MVKFYTFLLALTLITSAALASFPQPRSGINILRRRDLDPEFSRREFEADLEARSPGGEGGKDKKGLLKRVMKVIKGKNKDPNAYTKLEESPTDHPTPSTGTGQPQAGSSTQAGPSSSSGNQPTGTDSDKKGKKKGKKPKRKLTEAENIAKGLS